VMDGFLQWNISPLARRLITRSVALIPALWVLSVSGAGGVMPLLVASQVVLSLQLPFAVVPLLRLTNAAHIMGDLANSRRVRLAAGAAAALIVSANAALVLRTASAWRETSPAGAYMFAGVAASALLFLGWVALVPLRRTPEPEAAAYSRQVAQQTTLT